MNRVLTMWTVYEHPSDWPDWYVARAWEIHSDGPRATGNMHMARTLYDLRKLLPYGLFCMPRQNGDDPCIVEVWF